MVEAPRSQAERPTVADEIQERLCLIGLCGTDGVGGATVARLRRAARERGLPLCAVAAWPAERLVADLAIGAAAADAVAGVGDAAGAGLALLDRLAGLGIDVVVSGQAGYPQELRRFLGGRAPAVLFTAGDTSILARARFAVVGSRHPSRRAAAAARQLAHELAAAGGAVVSGGARGIDMAAHTAAAAAGGTVAVPAAGLARFRRRGMDVAGLARSGWYALGQFPAESGWRGAHALLRNRTIVALSRAVVAFEPRDSGGTWHSSLWALRMRKPLFVVTAVRRGATGRGLDHLVRQGAVALDAARMPDAAELARLVAEYRPPPWPAQLPLLGS